MAHSNGRRNRRITHYSALITVLGIGCSQSPPEPAAATPNVTVAAATPTPTEKPLVQPVANTNPGALPQPTPVQPVQPVAVQPKPPEPPTVFDYPTDLGGKAVVKAVTPSIPPLTGEKFGVAPKPRAVPARVLDPDPVTKAEYVPPPILFAKPAEVKPSAPPERVPFDLGLRANDIPAKPTFPVAAGITEKARDVNLPPAMPILGRPLNERVSLEDPTAEAGTAVIVAPLVKVTVNPAGFLKVTLPDPFELGEQVKPRVPATAEPGLAPVVVNPQRVK